eukprot:m.103048 g.103048  ORF g.103048 m.103048 type:complete len:300 (+) comp9040_c0_seq2:547-1446(+)
MGVRTGPSTNRPEQPRAYVLADDEAGYATTRGSYHFWSTTREYFGCLMPKVGCSSWLHYIRTQQLPPEIAEIDTSKSRIYRPISRDEHGLHFRRFHPLDAARSDGRLAAKVLRNPRMFKFAVVRHPWWRLVSAYRSKYEGACAYSRSCLRDNFQLDVNVASSDVLSFHEFVEALGRSNPLSLNPHFRPAALLCELDRIPYDFIAELMSVSDTDYVSQRLGYNTTFAEAEAKRFAMTGSDRYYGGRTHHIHNCTEQTVAIAARIYAADASLLGYSFQDAYDSCRRFGLSEDPEMSADSRE